jgi:hypothetical protein
MGHAHGVLQQKSVSRRSCRKPAADASRAAQRFDGATAGPARPRPLPRRLGPARGGWHPAGRAAPGAVTREDDAMPLHRAATTPPPLAALLAALLAGLAAPAAAQEASFCGGTLQGTDFTTQVAAGPAGRATYGMTLSNAGGQPVTFTLAVAAPFLGRPGAGTRTIGPHGRMPIALGYQINQPGQVALRGEALAQVVRISCP